MKRILYISAVILLLWVGLAGAANNVYFSICPFGTGNLLSGGSPTIVIDANGDATLTLGGATLVDNIGQGVCVEFYTTKLYISSIVDPCHFHLVDNRGVDAAPRTSAPVTSIHHVFSGMINAGANITYSAYLGGNNLTDLDVNIKLACYYDHDDYTPDGGQFTFQTAFTGVDDDHQIEFYTPRGLAYNESINNQRHSGKLDEQKYIYQNDTSSDAVPINTRQFRQKFIGLQVRALGISRSCIDMMQAPDGAFIEIGHCILNCTGPFTYDYGVNISAINGSASASIHDNIIYGFRSASSTAGVFVDRDGGGTVYIYNNVIEDCYYGILKAGASAHTIIAKNNAIFNCTDDLSGLGAGDTIEYCAIDDADSFTGKVDISPGATEADGWNAAFTDYSTGDFSLASGSSLLGAGIGPALDANVPLFDIAGNPRSGNTCDIGVFEHASESARKLIFIHHSTGGYWLSDASGQLGKTFDSNGIYVRDINYDYNNDDFSPPYNSTVASSTDIGHWHTWFANVVLDGNGVPKRDNIMDGEHGVYKTTNKSSAHGAYTTTLSDPGGENEIIMFKSCFPNSNIYDDNDTVPADLYGRAYNYTVGGQNVHTISNTKALYNAILAYFKTQPDKMFVVVVSPPLRAVSTTEGRAANARSLANWLVSEWLQDAGWSNRNVFVFDYYNVLTHVDNRHTYDGDLSRIVHYTAPESDNYLVYPTGDDHPSATGHQKATADFVPLLNHWISVWDAWRSYDGNSWNTTIPGKWNGIIWSNIKVR